MMPTPHSGSNSISARVNEDFAEIFYTLSDSSADLLLSAMLNDSNFVSEIFVNTNEVSLCLILGNCSHLQKLHQFMLSLKTETTLQHF